MLKKIVNKPSRLFAFVVQVQRGKMRRIGYWTEGGGEEKWVKRQKMSKKGKLKTEKWETGLILQCRSLARVSDSVISS